MLASIKVQASIFAFGVIFVAVALCCGETSVSPPPAPHTSTPVPVTQTPLPNNTPVPPTPTPTPTPRVVRIVQTNPTLFKVIEVSKIQARNCAGQNPVWVQESVNKSTTVEISVGTVTGYEMTGQMSAGINVGISAGLGMEITASLEKEYKVATGRQIVKTVSFGVEARPGTFFEYPVFWKEVWTEGYVVLQNWDGTQFTVPFSIRYSLQGEILDGVNIGCP